MTWDVTTGCFAPLSMTVAGKADARCFAPLSMTRGPLCHPERSEGSLSVTERQVRRHYYVYIMTNKSGTLYTGMTNDLRRRVSQHKGHLVPGFTSRYNITRLVWYDMTRDVRTAIAREKQIKGWLRRKKIALIEEENPEWRDLTDDWV